MALGRSGACAGGEIGKRDFLVGFERQANEKGSAPTRLGFEPDLAAVFLDNYGVRYGQPLPASLANVFGGEEWVEDARPDVGRNAATGILDGDFGPGVDPSAAYGDFAFPAVVCDFRDGVSRIHQQIENDLVELAGEARNQAHVGRKFYVEVGDILPFVAGNGDRRLDRLVNIDGLLLFRTGMGKAF